MAKHDLAVCSRIAGKYRVLIVGLGSIGRRHLCNLLQLGVDDILLLRTKADPVQEALELPVLTDLKEALDAGPDVVFVCTPTAHHLSIAQAAAKTGSALFIEKPLSHTWDGVPKLLAAVYQRNLITMVGFDMRFDPGLQKAKQIVDEGHIGRVLSIQAQVGQYLPDWHPWEDYRQGVSAKVETGGGVILDLIHELDYVRWLMGPVSRIGCLTSHASSLEIETEDVAGIVLGFKSGAIGVVSLDYLQRTPSRTCRLVGEKGTIVWDYFAQRLTWYESGNDRWQTFDYPAFERNDRFLAEMRHLLACLRGEATAPVDVFAASEVLRLALAAYESARTGHFGEVG